jgi:hypothetical protein
MTDHGWFITEPPPVSCAERSCAEHVGSPAGTAKTVRVVDADALGVTVEAVGGGLETAPEPCAAEVVDGEVAAGAECVAGLWLHPASVATDNDADAHPSTQRRDGLLIVPPPETWSVHRVTADHKHHTLRSIRHTTTLPGERDHLGSAQPEMPPPSKPDPRPRVPGPSLFGDRFAPVALPESGQRAGCRRCRGVSGGVGKVRGGGMSARRSKTPRVVPRRVLVRSVAGVLVVPP